MAVKKPITVDVQVEPTVNDDLVKQNELLQEQMRLMQEQMAKQMEMINTLANQPKVEQPTNNGMGVDRWVDIIHLQQTTGNLVTPIKLSNREINLKIYG